MTGSPYVLVPEITASGETQMEIDEQILDAVTAGYVPGVLRFYRFSRPCITFGRFQTIGDFATDRCREDGVDLVQRQTGGTAVYHGTGDITYAFSSTTADPLFGGNIFDSCSAVHEVIRDGLSWLGLPVELTGIPAEPPERVPDCFAAPSAHELVCRGEKLVGSAQVRNRTAYLQHGLIPMEPSRISEYLAGGGGAHIGISTLASNIRREEVIERITNCFATALGAPLLESSVLLNGMSVR